jgi:hypothetical protein
LDGAHPEDVAEVLGLDRSTVFKSVARYREGGIDTLKAKPVPGRPAKLEGRQIARLYALIVGNDPRQLQFDYALWTLSVPNGLRALVFKAGLTGALSAALRAPDRLVSHDRGQVVSDLAVMIADGGAPGSRWRGLASAVGCGT